MRVFQSRLARACEPYLGRLRAGKGNVVAAEHGFDGGGVALGEPEALGVFVHDEGVAVAVGAAEQDYGVVGEAVVQCTKPFDGAGVVPVVES